MLMWGNARPHAAANTKQCLARRKVEPIKQSPYSPDLNLCDRFLFRKLKHLLRNEEFNAHEDLTQGVQRQPERLIKIWLASFFMGCLGKMQDGVQPKIAQETRYR